MAELIAGDTASPAKQNLVTLTYVMYAMHAFSALMGVLSPVAVLTAFLTGWPSIIAVIINYIKNDDVRGTYLESHFSWQRRTFWYALLWVVVAGVLIFTFIGIPLAMLLAFGVGIWIIYRILRGVMALMARKPVRGMREAP